MVLDIPVFQKEKILSEHMYLEEVVAGVGGRLRIMILNTILPGTP